MEQFKRAKVIMLPTKNISPINLCTLYLHNSKIFNHPKNSISQHLYIISDDEIKENDWCYDKTNNKIVKVIYRHKNTKSHYFVSVNVNNEIEILRKGYSIELTDLQKIIATTDKLLKIKTYYEIEVNQKINLPQPSEQFITKYIEEYNKSEIITDVLVEYELLRHEEIPSKFWEERYKVNPKDNTITIKKLKDSWSKEELDFILNSITNDLCCKSIKKPSNSNECVEFVNRWKNKNL